MSDNDDRIETVADMHGMPQRSPPGALNTPTAAAAGTRRGQDPTLADVAMQMATMCGHINEMHEQLLANQRTTEALERQVQAMHTDALATHPGDTNGAAQRQASHSGELPPTGGDPVGGQGVPAMRQGVPASNDGLSGSQSSSIRASSTDTQPWSSSARQGFGADPSAQPGGNQRVGGSVASGRTQTWGTLPQSFASTLTHKPFDLPEFSGLPEQWPMFSATFRQSTSSFGYTPLQNVFRLQKALKGEAREEVQFLLINPDNVDTIMQTLEFRFGRPEILVQSQRAKLRELNEIPERRLDMLITLSSRVQNLVAFLNTDESRHVLSETSLLAECVEKLPPAKQLEWIKHSHNIRPRPTVFDFSTWLKELAECVCLLSSQSTQSTTQKANAPATQQQSRRQPKHILSVTEKQPGVQCGVCSRAHKLADCDKFRRLPISDRWSTARRLRTCFGCLKPGHRFDACRTKRMCPFDGCTYSHHELLHDAGEAQREGGDERRAGPGANADATAAPPTDGHVNPFSRQPDTAPAGVHLCREERNEQADLLYRILPVTLHNGNRHVHTYALLDDGSGLTLITTSLANDLNLRGPTASLNAKWFEGPACSKPTQIVSLQISGADERRYDLINVRTVRELELPSQTISISANDDRHQHLHGLPIAEYRDVVPRILLGLRQSHLGLAREVRESSCGGPIAAKTRLGWVVYGSQNEEMPARILHVHDDEPVAESRLEKIERMVRDFYQTESFGAAAPVRTLESDDDMRARRILADTTVRVGDRFATGLLWRSDEVHLPNSLDMARRRLASVQRKMDRDPAYAQLYQQQIDGYVVKGYARKLSPTDARFHDDRTWYLPHFGVQSTNKPGKLRIVFDAAAEVRGVSLNSVLLSGPDLNQPLAAILMKFRMGRVGVCGDIAEMFHQVMVREEDRRAQRFLWSGVDGGPAEVYEMLAMTFGATCSPTAAQYVKNRNADEHAAEFPAAAHAIKCMHYVDDFVGSFASEEEATKVTRDVVEVHRRGGFRLRGFVSNSPIVLRALGDAKQNDTIDLHLDNTGGERILGMRWRTRDDVFTFALQFDRADPAIITGERPPTKRELLSAAMSVFDPFGFLANFLLPLRVLVQEAFKEKVDWDAPITADINDRWRRWCGEVERTRKCRISRCYSVHIRTALNVQLHIFADASEEAFAAVGYWRIEYMGGCDVAFVLGKARCAPMKKLTVPRLELEAATMAVRMYNTIRQCHDDVAIERVVLWTDARTVVRWVQCTRRRFKPFVQHRVAEILESTPASWWRWIPTQLNVADDATRSRSTDAFDHDGRWLRGPAFLRGDESSWPTENAPDTPPEDELLEEEIRPRYVGVVGAAEVISFNRFSSFSRLRRATAWALRFAHNARARAKKIERRHGRELDVSELTVATDVLCRVAQREAYAAEYQALEDRKSIDRSSTLFVLMPYMDANGLLRLYGRTDAVEGRYMQHDMKRPVLLPRKHRLTELIVQQCHVDMSHQFEDATICAVRHRYWVPHLRQLVRSVKSRCMVCRLRATQPHPPIAGQLPTDRVTPHVHAFNFTGLDYFGPVSVTVGRRREKRWIALFTCLTIRAVHMEIASDLSTDACLLAIKNFCNQRGVPARLRSDCGTNFVGADNVLRRTADFIDNSAMQRKTSTWGIEWLFNCPANPEAGGAWERMVQSAKRVLGVVLKEVAPSVETLRSVIIEAANIINARPLTHVPVDPTDLEPLTPNHFLLGRVNAVTSAGENDPSELCSRKSWRVQQQLMRQFWVRWVADYLPELTRRTKAHKHVAPLQVGALVLICDANQSRGQWLRGRIERVVLGTDGRARTAVVRTSTGELRRPVSKLAILDVDGERPTGALTGPGMSPSGAGL